MGRFEQLEAMLRRECPGIEIRKNEPMSRYTTFRIGGPVRLMAVPATVEETLTSIRAARSLGVEPFLLGRGSNLLCGDGLLDYFVILTTKGLDQIERIGDTEIRCGAGAMMRQVAGFAQQEGLTGFEFAHGIPGSMGGGVAMNAGAYGGELKNVVVETTAMDRDGNIRAYKGEEQQFSYRHSVFLDQGLIVLHSLVQLKKDDSEAIQARMDDYLARRRRTQPLEYASAGSTFKRPVNGFAAAMIDQCGLKGYHVGAAEVSEKHAGFVVNKGGATCADILRLTDHVREVVARETGTELEFEIRLMQ